MSRSDDLEWIDDLMRAVRQPPDVITVGSGTPTKGVWCDVCQTSGIVLWPVHALGASGVSELGTRRHCYTCDPTGNVPSQEGKP